jgi:hypothetical protein
MGMFGSWLFSKNKFSREAKLVAATEKLRAAILTAYGTDVTSVVPEHHDEDGNLVAESTVTYRTIGSAEVVTALAELKGI